jgi:hypothetical protein
MMIQRKPINLSFYLKEATKEKVNHSQLEAPSIPALSSVIAMLSMTTISSLSPIING